MRDIQANSINERKGQQACAECLGIVGAVDPARVSLAMQPPAKLAQTQHVLLTTLLTEHLVRILRVASSLQVLDAASVAIQVCPLIPPPSLSCYSQGSTSGKLVARVRRSCLFCSYCPGTLHELAVAFPHIALQQCAALVTNLLLLNLLSSPVMCALPHLTGIMTRLAGDLCTLRQCSRHSPDREQHFVCCADTRGTGPCAAILRLEILSAQHAGAAGAYLWDKQGQHLPALDLQLAAPAHNTACHRCAPLLMTLVAARNPRLGTDIPEGIA